jgi:protein TonB
LPGLITGDDYPESSRDRNEEGTVGVRLTVGTNGRVAGCSVTKSSGHPALDSTTCRVLSSRARFTPAVDQNGAPIQDSVSTNITWRLVD